MTDKNRDEGPPFSPSDPAHEGAKPETSAIDPWITVFGASPGFVSEEAMSRALARSGPGAAKPLRAAM
ncbi:MAG TPA: hypothetical protein VE397_14770 [Stellaceae bacterium]|jgi:hypothetical protein|nr:hypothetical protein [Stellaceae bacterium]